MGRGGGFEVPSGGIPSPPSSPGATPSRQRPSLSARRRSGDAALHITEECERLFCETLKTVFLVEKDSGLENSLVMDLRTNNGHHDGHGSDAQPIPQSTVLRHGQVTPSPSPDGRVFPKSEGGMIKEYVEVYDYAGGARFRGFVAEKEDMRSMFIFFDKEVIGMDLKPGLMSLLELASSEHFSCDQLVICVDRNADEADVKEVNRNLGWVGFELVMLDSWTSSSSPDQGCLSEQYLFLGIDL